MRDSIVRDDLVIFYDWLKVSEGIINGKDIDFERVDSYFTFDNWERQKQCMVC